MIECDDKIKTINDIEDSRNIDNDYEVDNNLNSKYIIKICLHWKELSCNDSYFFATIFNK